VPARPRLAGYGAKRDFATTPEPAPSEPPERQGPLVFMVHRHAARQLHYDLRLELDGVLVSWAVPKGPSADPSARRLAVHVEDHPFEYGRFEGLIPERQYGAGPSLIWDAGTFSPDEGGRTYWDDRAGAERELRQGIAAGKVSFTLRGRKLKGSWALVRTTGERDQWLLIKHKDGAARTAPDVLADATSVLSGLTAEQLRREAPQESAAVWEPYASPADLGGARPSPLAFLAPMLATAAPIPESRDGWSYEPKLDGIRALATVEHGQVRLRSRGGHDIAAQYPGLVAELARQPVATVLFDGEIVAVDGLGHPSFELLQQRMNLQDPGQVGEAERTIPVVYFVFDVLHADGYDLAGATLVERRSLLSRLLLPSARVCQVATIETDAGAAFEAAVASGFEGIVAKRNDSRYQSGRRGPAWLKRKKLERAEFVVGGFTPGLGSRSGTFGGLLLGEPSRAGLVYRGRVGGGFTDDELDRVMGALAPLASDDSPFATATPDDRRARWVRPGLRILVEHAGMTSAGVLRQPVAKGLVGIAKVQPRTERVAAPADAASASISAQLDAQRQRLVLEGPGWSLAVTNLDKELWPSSGQTRAITKRDLLGYAARVAPVALPHLRDRPLTLLRFPNGVEGKRFYQRHWEQPLPPFVETVVAFAEGEQRDRTWLLCNNLPTLLWLCQVADVEWHASLARVSGEPDARSLPAEFGGSLGALEASLLNYPDFLLFDLDPYVYAGGERPGEEPQPSRAGFAKTCDVAFSLKDMLDGLGLASFVKTSGATGVHVYVPIVRNLEYEVVRAAANTVCAELAARCPRDVTLEWATEKRTGRVFLDANQNARHKSLAAPYSPRAKPGGPVSLPQSWGELGTLYPGDTTILEPWWIERNDPWADILEHKHDLETMLGLA
jgi:bifunctional non-homologous end joining protein LigD